MTTRDVHLGYLDEKVEKLHRCTNRIRQMQRSENQWANDFLMELAQMRNLAESIQREVDIQERMVLR